MTPTTLVTGPSAAAREAAIASVLDTSATTALILEGLPSGSSPIGMQGGDRLSIVRIAPGCICCTGNLTMRVTLNRVLRQRPSRLYIGVASSAHLDAIRRFLAQAPYDGLLSLTKDLIA